MAVRFTIVLFIRTYRHSFRRTQRKGSRENYWTAVHTLWLVSTPLMPVDSLARDRAAGNTRGILYVTLATWDQVQVEAAMRNGLPENLVWRDISFILGD